MERVTVNAGTGGDTFNVLGTNAALTSVFAGGGDDTIAFGNGATLSGGLIDGGTGTNTLVLASAVAVNLTNADQTSGDAVNPVHKIEGIGEAGNPNHGQRQSAPAQIQITDEGEVNTPDVAGN